MQKYGNAALQNAITYKISRGTVYTEGYIVAMIIIESINFLYRS